MDRAEAWAWVADNKGLVRAITWRLVQSNARPDCTIEDVMPAALIGAVIACETFDATKGAVLTTWVGVRVRSYVLDELRRIRHITGFDRHVGRRGQEVELERLNDEGQWYFPFEPTDDGGLAEAEHRLGGRPFEKLVAGLATREREVMTRYYVQGETLRAIGEAFGVTEARICQIKNAALARLREQLEGEAS